MSHMLCRATQDGWIMLESSDKTWSTGEGNSKPFQHPCLENPMNSSVQFSCSVVSNSVTPIITARQASLSIISSHSSLTLMSIESVMPSTISFSVIPISHLQCFPASGSFPRSQFFASDGQSTGVSASALVLLVNIQD